MGHEKGEIGERKILNVLLTRRGRKEKQGEGEGKEGGRKMEEKEGKREEDKEGE